MARILYNDENFQPLSVEIGPRNPEITIGRNSGNGIRIVSRSLSRNHAKIVYSDGVCYLIDLKSSNGCYVNGRRIESEAIFPGDEIRCGEVILRFEDDSIAKRAEQMLSQSSKPAPSPVMPSGMPVPPNAPMPPGAPMPPNAPMPPGAPMPPNAPMPPLKSAMHAATYAQRPDGVGSGANWGMTESAPGGTPVSRASVPPQLSSTGMPSLAKPSSQTARSQSYPQQPMPPQSMPPQQIPQPMPSPSMPSQQIPPSMPSQQIPQPMPSPSMPSQQISQPMPPGAPMPSQQIPQPMPSPSMPSQQIPQPMPSQQIPPSMPSQQHYVPQNGHYPDTGSSGLYAASPQRAEHHSSPAYPSQQSMSHQDMARAETEGDSSDFPFEDTGERSQEDFDRQVAAYRRHEAEQDALWLTDKPLRADGADALREGSTPEETEALMGTIGALQNKVTELRAENDNLLTENGDLLLRIEKSESSMESMLKELNEAKSKEEQRQSECDALKEQLEEKSKAYESLLASRSDSDKKHVEEILDVKIAELGEKNEQLHGRDALIEELRETIAAKEGELTQLRETLTVESDANGALRESNAKHEQELEILRQELEHLRCSEAYACQDGEDNDRLKQALSEANEAREAESEAWNMRLAEKDAQISGLKSEKEDIKSANEGLRIEMDALLSELTELRALAEAKESFDSCSELSRLGEENATLRNALASYRILASGRNNARDDAKFSILRNELSQFMSYMADFSLLIDNRTDLPSELYRHMDSLFEMLTYLLKQSDEI